MSILLQDFSNILREHRQKLGLSQQDVARSAKVSLATLQNIEAGRANPSLKTIESLFEALGLEVSLNSRPADWDALALCGAPIESKHQRNPTIEQTPSTEVLLTNLRAATLELSSSAAIEDHARKEDSIRALLAALKAHFHRFYQTHCARSPLLARYTPHTIDGRLLRLRRIAVARLATYL